MDLPQAVVDHLTGLTEALDVPGADLVAMLEVLLDDVVTAVRSFCGLRLTIPAHVPGTVGLVVDVPTTAPPGPARASLYLPLPALAGNRPTDDESRQSSWTAVTFYAGTAGAFVDLAADLRLALGLDGEVVIDGHLHHWPPGRDPDDRDGGLARPSADDVVVISQAVGFLIGRGHLPEAASTELHRQAHAQGVSAAARARQLLAGQ